MTVYVGNLPRGVGEEELRSLFGEYGEVSDIVAPKDWHSGTGRGLAYVEMANDEDALTAIKALDGTCLEGQTIWVNKVRSRGDWGDRGSSALRP